jgi:hypothetical protein
MSFLNWVSANTWWLVSLSVLAFVGTLVLIPVVVVRMPSDYFMRKGPPPDSWRGRHPVVRTMLHVAKNGLGASLVGVGIVLSVPLVPGQGFATILIGLSLLDFPGKRGLELKLARQKPVLRAINWVRSRAARPPLVLPERHS